MSCPRDHVAGGKPGCLRPGPHRGDAFGVEGHGRRARDGDEPMPKPVRLRRLGHQRGNLLFHPVQDGVVGMAQVDGRAHLAGDDVVRVRTDLEEADGADGVLVAAGDAVDAPDHLRHADKRVAAQVHRRRAGVGRSARQAQVEPAHPLHALHHADLPALGLEDRALLDVQLEHRAEADRARLGLATPADAVERGPEAVAPGIGPAVAVIAAVDAGPDARAQHGGREARAFLVRPVDQHQRRLGLEARLVKRPQHLEPREDAQHTVELAARGLGVQVAAHGDGRQVRAPPRAGGEHVARLVHDHRHSQRIALRPEPVPHAAVVLGQRQAGDAAVRGAADLRRFHETAPQPGCVDLEVGHGVLSFPPQAALTPR